MLPQGGHHYHREAGIDFLKTGEKIEATFFPRCGVAGVIEIDEQNIVVALAQRFEQKLRRAHTVDVDALRFEQQFNSFENVWLVVCDENPDTCLLA